MIKKPYNKGEWREGCSLFLMDVKCEYEEKGNKLYLNTIL